MHLTFLGATDTVTGSRFLVGHDRVRILIDCGLFQGLRDLRRRNWLPFPVPPDSIDALILTHAHIDHSGYVPALIKQGFRGRVFCTAATADLCAILWPDAGHLQEEEAEYRNRKGATRHHPALPIYTARDGERALKALSSRPMGQPFKPASGLTASFTPAGHILGSAYVRLSDGRHTLTFSGDVGRPRDLLMQPPAPLTATDYLVLESTYGDRRHDPADPADTLESLIRDTAARGGVVVIPAFAVGRAQTVLHMLDAAMTADRIPDLPVYLDSPMAIDATDIFCRHADEHRLDADACRSMCRRARFTATVEESKAIAATHGPKVIVSASGMASGGRVLHHLRHYLPDAANTVVFVGFQAAGTLGARLVTGERVARIFGQDHQVNARIAYLDGLSAHADGGELVDWIASADPPPRKTFLVHGEAAGREGLRDGINSTLGWNVVLPAYQQTFDLDAGGRPLAVRRRSRRKRPERRPHRGPSA